MTKTHKKEVKKKRTIRFRGINADAVELGVRREHLWMVLTGRRESAILNRRYKALKQQQAEEAA